MENSWKSMKKQQPCSIELGIDLETFSSVDIANGAYAYAASPDFEILLIGYKFSDEEEVRCVDLTQGEEIPERFREALTDPSIIKTAFNAQFERACLAQYTGQEMPPEQWRCTQVLAVQIGLPRALKDVGAALGLKEEDQKLKTGAALIQYFCKPCKPTKANGNRTRNLPKHSPERWALFKEYNIQDVHTEQTILEVLRKYRPDETEQALWTLDQEINDRGVLLDIDMAQTIVTYSERHKTELMEEAQRLTGLANPNSRDQLLGWLGSRGIDTDGLKKADVEELLGDEDLPEDVRRVLEIRAAASKTSVNKYQTMLDVASHDGRARGIMQFYGGHTGRWAGRSLQPQNLTRNEMPDAELDAARELVKLGDFDGLEMIFGEPTHVLSQLVRTAFIPSPGCRFVVSDFSAIEARVIAWVAGEEWRLNVFRNNGDIYCESASRIYHKPVVKHGINGELRQRGKIAELALGYGGSVGAMKAMDTTGSVPEEEMQGIVKQWRRESPSIVKMWGACQDAAVEVIEGEAAVKRLAAFKNITFRMAQVNGSRVLRIYLPNGRPISYWEPQVMDTEMGPRITYMNQNQTTKKWERTETYGGKLTENIVQSIARDCLADKMKQMDAQGYKIVFHVHDEMILDVPRSDTAAADLVDRAMGEPLDWAPGLPLKGGTYECDFYRKD